MRYLFSLLLLASLWATVVAQEPEAELGQGCETAIPLSFDDASFINPEALGVINLNCSQTSLGLFVKDLNLTWYKFSTTAAGLVGFDIRPLVGTDNLDFLLFRAPNNKACVEIASGLLQPVVKNLAAASAEFPVTGLAPGQDKYGYADPVTVQKSEDYILVVNNVNGTDGHQVSLNYYRQDLLTGTIAWGTTKLDEPVEVLWVAADNNEVISRVQADSQGNFSLRTIVNTAGDQTEDYRVLVVAKGFGLVEMTVDPNKQKTPLQVQIQPLTMGAVQNTLDEHLYFSPNSSEKLDEASQKRLIRLLRELRFNPTLKIQLEGHSNGVFPSTEVDSKLSYNRAQWVKDQLMSQGIEAHRVFVKALGSNQQLYPKAKNEEEENRNRRVEIRYIDF